MTPQQRKATLANQLEKLSADHKQFMATLCPLIRDDMLTEVARCDYGMDEEQHFTELVKIRDRQMTSSCLEWEPKEVLELFRWSEYGDDRSGQEPRSKRDFHRIRAFCCAALLDAATRPQNKDMLLSTNETAVQLIESVGLADAGLEPLLPAFLAYSLKALEDDDVEKLHHLFGLVWALCNARRGNDPALHDLIEAIVHLESECRQIWPNGVGRCPTRPILGLTFHDLKNDKWTAIGRRLAGSAHQDIDDAKLRERVIALARGVAGDS